MAYDGEAVVLWRNGSRLSSAALSAAGAWAPTYPLGTSFNLPARSPDVVFGSTRIAVGVWTETNGTNDAVFTNWFLAGGEARPSKALFAA